MKTEKEVESFSAIYIYKYKYINIYMHFKLLGQSLEEYTITIITENYGITGWE